jgi:hypothetical protein
MFEHTPKFLLEERLKGTEWVDWWNDLDDGITRSSRHPVLAVEPRIAEDLGSPSPVPFRSAAYNSPSTTPQALCA